MPSHLPKSSTCGCVNRHVLCLGDIERVCAHRFYGVHTWTDGGRVLDGGTSRGDAGFGGFRGSVFPDACIVSGSFSDVRTAYVGPDFI